VKRNTQNKDLLTQEMRTIGYPPETR